MADVISRRYIRTGKTICHRIIDLHLVVFQWYFCDTFEASGSSRPNECNIDEVRAAREKTWFSRQFDSFFISLKSFLLTNASAIVWLLVERADNVNFDLARFTAPSPAINDATSTSSSKSSQSIFCAHHMLEMSFLVFMYLTFLAERYYIITLSLLYALCYVHSVSNYI